MNALRRVPPVVLALAATLVLIGLVVAAFTLLGGDHGRDLPPCSAAQDAGPYGCVVFVSTDGSVGGRAAEEASNGGITYRIERRDGRDRLIWTGDCAGGAAPVAVTRTRYRVGVMSTGGQTCSGGQAVDEWARSLFTGTVQVREGDQATVELVHGDRRARFAEVIAPRS